MKGATRNLFNIIYQNAKKSGFSEELARDFIILSEIINQDADFKNFMISPRSDREKKRKYLSEMTAGKISPTAWEIVDLMIENDFFHLFEEMSKELQKEKKKEGNIVDVGVESAVALTGEQESKLIKMLEKKYGQKVILHKTVNKDLIGGILVRFEDQKIIDLSLKNQLEKLRQKIII